MIQRSIASSKNDIISYSLHNKNFIQRLRGWSSYFGLVPFTVLIAY